MDEAQGHKAMNKLWRCCCGLASSKTLARAKKSKVGVRTLNSHSKGRNRPAEATRTATSSDPKAPSDPSWPLRPPPLRQQIMRRSN